MKKFLLSIACTAVAALTFGQQDIAITLNTPSDGDDILTNYALEIEFDIENTGVDDIVMTSDSVFFALKLDGQYASNGYFVSNLPSPFAPGDVHTVTFNQLSLTDNVAEGAHDVCVELFLYSGTLVVESDDTNNEDCSSVTVTSTASVDELTINTTSVYPNPANNEVNFELSQGAEEIAIYDLNGKLVNTAVVENDITTMDISNLENGIYLYTVRFENGEIKQEKLVVSK